MQTTFMHGKGENEDLKCVGMCTSISVTFHYCSAVKYLSKCNCVLKGIVHFERDFWYVLAYLKM